MPLAVTKDKLLERTEESEGLMKVTLPSENEAKSLKTLVESGVDPLTVYLVQVPDAAEDNNAATQATTKKYCSLKMVDVEIKGETCKAVYLCCMRHCVEAMNFQQAFKDQKN